MSILLYRLGGWAVRKKYLLLIVGIAVLALMLVLGKGLGSSFNGDLSIPGTKSEKTLAVLNQSFPQANATSNATMQIVFKALQEETLDSQSNQQKLMGLLDKFKRDPEVLEIRDPFQYGSLNASKKIGYATLIYKNKPGEVPESSLDLLARTVEESRGAGIQIEYSDNAGPQEVEVGGIAEAVGIGIAYVILTLTFASFLAAGLPILTALLGLGIGIMIIMISSNFISMSSVSLSLAVMLGLAVGIDYALFLISRYRQNLSEGKSIEQSAALANGTAGSAVVFAGMTVIIALLGLAVANIPFLTAMGVAAAVTVFIAILVAVIFVPAILGIAGERLRPRAKAAKTTKPKSDPASNAWGRFVSKYPLPVGIVAILLLLFISYPALHLKTGIPDNGMKSEEHTERRAYDLLAEAFGPGFNGPLVIIARSESETDPQGKIRQATNELRSLPDIAIMSEPIPDASGRLAMLNVIPVTGPLDAKTKELVTNIRDKATDILEASHVEIMVTGTAAMNIDISDKLNQVLPRFAILIVSLAIILLGMVFRSILIPIKAVLGYLLTLSATLGFIVFVVQDGHFSKFFGIPQPGPVLSFLPILVAGILFGLAMDYEVFLVSRMREEYSHSGNPKRAVLGGLKTSGTVVSAAGLIMIAVFASFVFAEDTMIKSMGLSLAFGILVDAFIVRMTIVPAAMMLMNKAAWFYPKWLDRITPNIDVEGESIQSKNDHSTP
ncbi:MMPL family transporter [Bacillus sp. FJAT-28004]|uniref:MMPL family transporter n=1 Tax=Bacillus sp. FJAT-28004 TaxID=1679165 RepID=UPI0006B44632|nr:MMPL family transporter [Bacillus sp. FJAT-28004]